MDKAIKRHILKKRILLAKRSDEPMTFTERAPKFFKWFEEDVMGFDSEEYRKEFWREAYKHGRTIGHEPHTLNDHLQSRGRRSEAAIIEALCIALLMGGAFAIWVMRRKIDQHLHHLRRPSYYETERARRLGLTEQRRRIRQRTTINARPDAEQLREAFIHARNSVGNMIRLGSLMEDLECYIDNSLIFGEDGKIIARKGGIRRYIQSEIPDLYKSYKTLMRYKALARRFRQAVGISDPVPAASVLPEEGSLPSKENMDVRTRVKTFEKGDVSAEVKNRPIEKENAEKDICGGKYAGQKRVENMARTNSHGGVRGSDGDMADGCRGGGKSSENECKRENRGVSGNEGIDGNEGKRENEGISGNEKDGGRAVGGRGAEDIDGKSAVAGVGVEGKDAKSVVGGMNGENHRLNDEVRRVVGEILDVCEGTFLNLSAVLALRICEDTIPHKCYGGACVGACA